MASDLLSPREKAAVLWAEHVTRNTARDRDDVYELVAEQFTEPEIVELTLMSGLFNMFNRFMDSLKIPVEVQHEVDKIQRSLHLDPDKVRTYYETVVETWPSEFPEPHPE
jgi:hypothetical protein